MKIIFLDIDGVLIRFWNTKQIRDTRSAKWDRWGIITSLDLDLLKNLSKIIVDTNCHIVVSSSWRRSERLMEEFKTQLQELFDDWEITDIYNRIISKTPNSLKYWRWNEILHWLNDYHRTCKSWHHITNWIAIDDDSFDMKCIKRLWNFVHTETRYWLTPDKMFDCIELLKRKWPNQQ